MVDTEAITDRIRELGLRKRDVAKYIGICENTLHYKLRTGDFRIYEAECLQDLLKFPKPGEVFFKGEKGTWNGTIKKEEW